MRSAAQVQLARLWRRLAAPSARAAAPLPAETPAPVPPKAPAVAAPAMPPVASPAPATSDALAADGVDGSLLGWAAHFLVEQARGHLGTRATRELLERNRRELLARHPALDVFEVSEEARVCTRLDAGLRLPREAVAGVAAWMVAFRAEVRKVAPDVEAVSVRAATALVADALRAAGFYAACDDFEAGLRR